MRLAAIAIFCSSLLLSGCGLGPAAGPVLNTSPDSMHGTIFGGQQPVAGATVSMYEVGSSAYGVASATPKASTTTDSNGNFAFGGSGTSYTCTASNTPMYIVATGGTPGGFSANSSVAMLALIPACSAGQSAVITINEVTTAAAILSAGQFMGTTLGAGVVPQIGGTCTSCATGVYNKGLVAAFVNTYPALVNNVTGRAVASGVTNGITITRESAKLNTIANVLAACVNSNGATSTSETTTVCGQLFTGVNAKSANPRPSNTIQAGLLMALYPYYNVSAVYNLATPASPFSGLSSAPNDWTVAISYAYPNMSVGINGSANSQTSMNLDMDTSGRIWFPSTQSGAVGIGYFDPSSTTFNGPYNSTTSPLVHPQYVAIDSAGVAWISDLANPYIEGFTITSPSTAPTVLTAPSGGLTTGPISFDISDNLYVFYTKSSSVAEAEATTARTSLSGQGNITGAAGELASGMYQSVAYGLMFALSGSNTVCTMQTRIASVAQTSGTPCYSGGAAGYVLTDVAQDTAPLSVMSNNQFCGPASCYTPSLALNAPEGIGLDGNNQIWVANSGNSSITTYAPSNSSTPTVGQSATVAYIHDSTHGGTLTNPFALGIDGSGNVWTISPGCVTTGSTACTPGGMVLTNLVGAAGPTITPIAVQTVNSTFGTKPTG